MPALAVVATLELHWTGEIIPVTSWYDTEPLLGILVASLGFQMIRTQCSLNCAFSTRLKRRKKS